RRPHHVIEPRGGTLGVADAGRLPAASTASENRIAAVWGALPRCASEPCDRRLVRVLLLDRLALLVGPVGEDVVENELRRSPAKTVFKLFVGGNVRSGGRFHNFGRKRRSSPLQRTAFWARAEVHREPALRPYSAH